MPLLRGGRTSAPALSLLLTLGFVNSSAIEGQAAESFCLPVSSENVDLFAEALAGSAAGSES
jgi:hypothetical protein